MSIDPRGKKRGRCLAEECDCELYEYEERSGPKCFYCSCPPTKHQMLDTTVETISNGNCGVETNEDVINNTSQEVNYVLEVVESVTTSLSAPVVDACSSQLQDLLPKRLPKKVEAALTNKSLTPLLRNRIVRAIADKCFEEAISSKTVDAVANLAVQKWSPLKNQCGESPGGTLATQIKRRMAKLRLNDHKKQPTTSNESSEMDEAAVYNQLEMGNEMKKPYPSQLKLKQFLDGTRPKRKTDVNKMPALEILGLYPALKIADLLLWEFSQLVNVPESMMVQRWKEFVDAFKSYIIRTEGNCSYINESYESSTVEILLKLPMILVSGKRTACKKKLVLQILEENATVAGNVPAKTDPPRLIAVGDPTSTVTFFAYVDSCAIFTESCPIKSIILLLAVYWVFNIGFCPEARPSFLLLSSVLLQNEMPPARTSKCGAVACLLKQLSL